MNKSPTSKMTKDSAPSFQFESIGILRSCFSDRFGTPRQPHLVPHARATLQLRGDLNPQAITEGLAQFSHVWLLWVFHQNTNKLVRPKIHPPRLTGESIGVFASRTPHRPNPIGLSLVKLEKIENDTLHFCEVDLIDGTPILDIKPYIKESDTRANAQDSWAGTVAWTNWKVEIRPDAETFLSANAKKIPVALPELKLLITEVLSQDPRPLVYKGDDENPSPYREDYFIYLYNLNIRFRYGTGASPTGQGEPANAQTIFVESIDFK